MITLRTLIFLAILLAFLVLILGVAAFYYRKNRQRDLYPYGQWEDLLQRLAPINHQSLGRIVGDPAMELDLQSADIEAMDSEDIWELLGGIRGIELIERNCSVLVDLVFYVQQWYPEALLIAEQLRLNAREVEWHIGRIKASARSGRPSAAAVEYMHQAVAVYYRMSREVLALYEQANLPGLADLQRAI
jgi:hypothetical protein